jgi:hypothetical protein
MLLTNSTNAKQAHDRFDAFMIMMHLSKGEADKLWASLDHVARSGNTAKNSAAGAASVIGGALLRALKEVAKAWRVSLTETGSGHFSITGPGGQSVAGPGGRFNSGRPLAAGGYISLGTGPRADDVHIRASKGEFMVNAESTRKNRYLLEMINAGRFAGGGLIGLPHNSTDYVNSFRGIMTTTMEADMEAAMKAAIAAAKRRMISAAGSGGPASASARAFQAYAFSLFPQHGWGSSQRSPLVALWNGESGWNNMARNPSSGAFGIPQALPPSKMGALAASGNGAAQIRWGESYIASVYGSPGNAYGTWLSRSPHWYGGGLKRGLFTRPTVIGVGDRGAEHVSVTPAGAGGTQTVQLEIVPGGSGIFEQFMATFLRKYVRQKGGGDVQSALQGYRSQR